MQNKLETFFKITTHTQLQSAKLTFEVYFLLLCLWIPILRHLDAGDVYITESDGCLELADHQSAKIC